MSVRKQDTAFRKLIQVGSVHSGTTAHAVDPIIQVVHRDEQDVWTICKTRSVQRQNNDCSKYDWCTAKCYPYRCLREFES